MTMTIKSSHYGKILNFWCRGAGGYVYVDSTGTKPGTLGQQIMRDQHAITCDHDDQDEFERICKNWHRRQSKK